MGLNVKVEREYMVMKALKQVRAHASQPYMDSGPLTLFLCALQVNFPVPDLLAFTADSSVIGTPFYIMQFVTYASADLTQNVKVRSR